MLRKLNYIFIITILFSFLSGCNYNNSSYINISVKPNNHYYSDEIRSKILNNKNYTFSVFDTNLYKEIEVSSEDKPIIENFLSALSSSNYSEETIDKKEPYRIKIIFDDAQYLIKVFDDSLISISPWDGNYKEDIISMKDLPLRYNLFDFCNHIANEPLSSKK